MQIADEIVEIAAQAIQEWNAPNTKLGPVGDEFADAKRRLARKVLEAVFLANALENIRRRLAEEEDSQVLKNLVQSETDPLTPCSK